MGVPLPKIRTAAAPTSSIRPHVDLQVKANLNDRTFLLGVGKSQQALRAAVAQRLATHQPSIGIPVKARLNAVYALAGMLSGLAAVLLAGRMNAGFPLVGSGTLIGALIIAVLRNGLNLLNVSSHWQMIVIGAVIIWAVWVDVWRRRGGQH